MRHSRLACSALLLLAATVLLSGQLRADSLIYNLTIPDNDATASQNSDAQFANINGGTGYGCVAPSTPGEPAGNSCWLGAGYSPTVTTNPYAPQPLHGVYGTVLLQVVTGASCGTASSCVQVTVSGVNGFQIGGPYPENNLYPGFGPPAAAFAFNATEAVDVLGLPTGWAATTGTGAGGGALDDPFGTYSEYISGPKVLNGSLNGTVPTLTFYVAGSGDTAITSVLTLVKSNGDWPSGPPACYNGSGPPPPPNTPSCDGFYFAAHMYGDNSDGVFDSQVGAISPAETVPEPGTLLLLAAGLCALALLRRRVA